MSNQQLSISLSRPSREPKDLLFLEQKQEDPYVGKVTKSIMVEAVLGFIYPGANHTTGAYCGGVSDTLEKVVFAYLYDQDLNYTIDTSYGSLSSMLVEDLEYIQLVNCSLKEYVEFDYPNEEIIETLWEDSAYNNVGDVVPFPGFNTDKRGVYFDDRVYGSLKIRYKVRRHRYLLTSISRRRKDETVLEDKYAATVFAYWNGGVDWETMEIPYGYDDTDGQCKYVVTINTPDDPFQPPTADPDNKLTLVDYCEQEIIYEN